MALSFFTRGLLLSFVFFCATGCGGNDTGPGGSAGTGGVGGSAGTGGTLTGTVEERCLIGQCGKEAACDPSANNAMCMAVCTDTIAMVAATKGAECVTAYEGLFDCLNGLSCADWLIYAGEDLVVDYTCRQQDRAVNVTCLDEAVFCYDGCDVRISCNASTAPGNCAMVCNEMYQDEVNFSNECANALMALNVCIGALDCTQYATFEAGGAGAPCKTEQDAFDALLAAPGGCTP